MKLTYRLDENDYLQNQLYIASKTDRVKNQRRRSWIIVTLAFLSLGFIFSQVVDKYLPYPFIGLSLISLIFYPAYSRIFYKNYYKKSIKEIYKSRFNEPLTITFNDTTIETVDKTSESKINLSAVDEIAETADYIYLRINTGGSLVIPKSKIENADSVLAYLKELAAKLNIKFTQELNWKWS